jgi:hypothetical protein
LLDPKTFVRTILTWGGHALAFEEEANEDKVMEGDDQINHEGERLGDMNPIIGVENKKGNGTNLEKGKSVFDISHAGRSTLKNVTKLTPIHMDSNYEVSIKQIRPTMDFFLIFKWSYFLIDLLYFP